MQSTRSSPVNPEKYEREVANMTIFNKTFAYSNSTPIVSAIRAIVGMDDPNILVLDYRRDETEFKALWALGQDNVPDQDNVPTTETGKQLLDNLADANKTIILVDVDASTVIASDKFGRHLSALSWAHCLTHSLLLAKKPAPNIVILDLRNEANVHQDSTFADFFNLPSSPKPSNIRRFDASLAGFDEFFLHIIKKREVEPPSGDIKTFAKRWKSALVEADSRSTQHDLNNTMGPLSLAASVSSDLLSAQVIAITKNKNDVLGRAAMLQAMRWVVKSETVQSDFQPVHFGGTRELRILLLDDQAKDGWLPVLSHYLGLVGIPSSSVAPKSNESGFQQYAAASYSGGAQVSLWYATSPDLIVKMLGEEAKLAKQKVARIRFTKDTPLVGNGDFDELLLLDLRLYGGDAPTQVDAEKDFLKTVAAALHEAIGGARPTWSDQIEAECFREKPAYLKALTGLTQLISAVDFSYPIVVWSSTGQRKVTESLREFKNVYTGLEKPRFDSYMSNADDLRSALNDACLWARKQLQAVSFFGELMALNETPSWEPPGVTHPYAEVYIEEDGTANQQSFKVGALIAFYNSMASAEKLHQEIGKPHFGSSLIYKNEKNRDSFSGNNQELSQKKTTLAFCGQDRLPKKLSFDQLSVTGGKGYLNDIHGAQIADQRKAVSEKLAGLLSINQVKCMMVTSSLKAPTPQKDVDPRYLFLLSDVLRVALTFFMAGKDVRVFVATKRQSITSTTEQDALSVASNYFEKWGVLSEVKTTSTSYSSLNNHSALHAAIDAHSYSDGISSQAKLCGARGVTLSYKDAEPRPAHYEWQIFQNIFQSQYGSNVRPTLTVNGINGPKTFRNSEEALKCSFPHSISNKNSWRNLHYYADEILEKDGRKEYIKAGVVTEDSWFDRSLLSDDPNKDSQLLILSCGRSALQSNLTDAIESYASAVLGAESPSTPYADGNCKLRNFIGKRLAANLATNKESAKVAYETLLDVVEVKSESRNKKKKSEKHPHQQVGESLPTTGGKIVPAQTVASTSARLNVSSNENRVPIQKTPVDENLPLGKNELQIIDKNSVGDDGVPYMVLALNNGIPCAVLSMANTQVAECEIGQIIVVQNMYSTSSIKISHSDNRLAVLGFVRRR